MEVHLPDHIRAIQAAQQDVLWCCDPMHGNTEVLPGGVKTRRYETILEVPVRAGAKLCAARRHADQPHGSRDLLPSQLPRARTAGGPPHV